MTDSSPTPNTEGEGSTQIILPTEMLVDIGRRLSDQPQRELTDEQKNELLSAIMHELP
jgi:hypothetical protein